MTKSYKVAEHIFNLTLPDGSAIWEQLGQYSPFMLDEVCKDPLFSLEMVAELPQGELSTVFLPETEDGETVTYALGQGDRLATWTGGSYQYDAAGCVTRITRGADTWDLTWNGQYQLVSVSTNGAFAEAYAYDALGRRVTTTNAEGTERHVYDDSWQVIADLDASGNVIRSYVWGEGIDRLLAVKIGSRTYTALTDVQGTVWGYADEGGSVVARWTYDAWGNALTEEVDVFQVLLL